jgi:TolB-like protein/Flp pilus assembly protein TadD
MIARARRESLENPFEIFLKVVKAVGEEQENQFYEFGPFRVDVAGRALLREGKPIHLLPKSFDALLFLIRNSGLAGGAGGGKLLDKEFLMNGLWPDSPVEENNLSQAISALRKALGEGPKDQRYIVTVPRRGYRFAVEVKAIEGERAAAPPAAAEDESFVERRTQVNTLAVLPFVSLSSDSGDEYLAVGMADALITRLSGLKKVVVRSTSAVLKYAGRDTDVALAGRELKVDAVITGSVRKSGGRVRVTVQLVNVEDEASLWAGRFDEDDADIFAIEDSVSARIAAALAPELTGVERERLLRHRTADAQAYQLYLKGRHFWSRRTEEGMLQAVSHFRQAIDRDPAYALAHAGLADAYVLLGVPNAVMGGLPPREVYPQGKAAAERALELDDTLAEAHAALAHVCFFYDWDWPAAEREFEKSIDLNPNYATSRHWRAMALTMVMRPEAALAEIRKAQELEPLSPIIAANVGFILYLSRRFDEALARLLAAVELEPNFATTRQRLGLAYEAKGMYPEAIREFEMAMVLSGGSPMGVGARGYCCAVSGREEEARKVIEELSALSKDRYVSAEIVAEIYAGLGEADSAFRWLEQAYQDRSSRLASLKVNPRWDSLRSDPRFQDLLRRAFGD